MNNLLEQMLEQQKKTNELLMLLLEALSDDESEGLDQDDPVMRYLSGDRV